LYTTTSHHIEETDVASKAQLCSLYYALSLTPFRAFVHSLLKDGNLGVLFVQIRFKKKLWINTASLVHHKPQTADKSTDFTEVASIWTTHASTVYTAPVTHSPRKGAVGINVLTADQLHTA